MMKRWLLPLLCLLFMLAMTGCSSSPTIKETPPVDVALPDDIVSFDAARIKDSLSESVARCIFSTLYTFDENLQLVPCLAESGERISELEWEFKLRKDVTFHDGSELTASDVKFSIERAKVHELVDNNLDIIDHIEVLDPYTIKMITQAPCTDLRQVLVRISSSIMSEQAMSKPDYNLEQPIGSGPFRFVSHEVGKQIALVRNDQYFLEPAKVSSLNFMVESSEHNRTSGLLNGQFDLLYRVSPADGDYLRLSEGVTLYECASTKMEMMIFNTQAKPLDDIRVRQAIAHAMDRQSIIENVVVGYGEPIYSVLPPSIPGSIQHEQYAYNPERAKELLVEAGYPNGFDLTVLTFDEQRKKLMEYIKLDLAKVGIKINYEFLTLSDYLDTVANDEHVATIMSWTSNPDPDSTFTQLYSKDASPTLGQSRFYDERVETLLVEGRKESDAKKRLAIYEEMNQIICDACPALPIYCPNMLVAASNQLGGVSYNAQGLFGFENLYHIDA